MKAPAYTWNTDTVLTPEQELKNLIIDYVNAHETFTVWDLTKELNIRFKDNQRQYVAVTNFIGQLKNRRHIVSQYGKYFRVSKIDYKYA